MIFCPRCGKDNEEGNRFCGRCGLEMATAPSPAREEAESVRCYRHRKETTRLRCGRCDRPICTRCARIGPAGPRCPDCARNMTPISWRGIAHDALRTITVPFRGGVYNWYLILLIFVVLGGSLRGCVRCAGPHRGPVEREVSEEGRGQAPEAER